MGTGQYQVGSAGSGAVLLTSWVTWAIPQPLEADVPSTVNRLRAPITSDYGGVSELMRKASAGLPPRRSTVDLALPCALGPHRGRRRGNLRRNPP